MRFALILTLALLLGAATPPALAQEGAAPGATHVVGGGEPGQTGNLPAGAATEAELHETESVAEAAAEAEEGFGDNILFAVIALLVLFILIRIFARRSHAPTTG